MVVLATPAGPKRPLLSQIQRHSIPADEPRRLRWEQPIIGHRLWPKANLVGEVLRYVAVSPAGAWLALLGWASAALRLGPRNRWIAWSEAQRSARLPSVAQNSRVLILADRPPYPNLASRVLGLCTARLSADWQAGHGAGGGGGTFSDPGRFAGAS